MTQRQKLQEIVACENNQYFVSTSVIQPPPLAASCVRIMPLAISPPGQ
jgi:hypothetical protein